VKYLNGRIILAAVCLAALHRIGLADTADAPAPIETPAETPAPPVKPVHKNSKKHHKAVKPASDDATPKVMVLSNDDLPKRHNYYAPQDAAAPTPPAAAANSGAPMIAHPSGGPPVPNAAGTSIPANPPTPTTTPAGALDAAAPRIAPSSDPADVPTPDASAVHSAGDLNKDLPLNKRP
jgi:hypothetical protein